MIAIAVYILLGAAVGMTVVMLLNSSKKDNDQ